MKNKDIRDKAGLEMKILKIIAREQILLLIKDAFIDMRTKFIERLIWIWTLHMNTE